MLGRDIFKINEKMVCCFSPFVLNWHPPARVGACSNVVSKSRSAMDMLVPRLGTSTNIPHIVQPDCSSSLLKATPLYIHPIFPQVSKTPTNK